MPSLVVARSSNAASCPSYIPVFVAIGGTSGIGKEMVRAFARYTKGRAHIIILGRNEKAADSILASLPTPSPTSSDKTNHFKREFLYCDVQLMKNVHTASRELLVLAPKINYLVLSAGIVSLKGFDPTEEGIDKRFASRYYSRWTFTYNLLPALRKAHEAGEAAGMMSVLGAGLGPPVDLNDLGLTKNFGAMKAMYATGTYNDLMVSAFANREPDIAFTHVFPGFVMTGYGAGDSWVLQLVFFILTPIIWIFGVKADICAEYMLYALFNNMKGMSLRNDRGDKIHSPKHGYQGDEVPDRIWEHSGDRNILVKRELGCRTTFPKPPLSQRSFDIMSSTAFQTQKLQWGNSELAVEAVADS